MKQKPIVQLIPVIAFLSLCIAIVSLISSLAGISRRRTILQTSREELTNLQKKSQELNTQLHIVESPEFIEKTAREKLNLAKPGETIILVNQPTTENGNSQQITTIKTNWRQWWDIFF